MLKPNRLEQFISSNLNASDRFPSFTLFFFISCYFLLNLYIMHITRYNAVISFTCTLRYRRFRYQAHTPSSVKYACSWFPMCHCLQSIADIISDPSEFSLKSSVNGRTIDRHGCDTASVYTTGIT